MFCFTALRRMRVAKTNRGLRDSESADFNRIVPESVEGDSLTGLGWISDAGEEIGDFPLHANVPITSIVREVPLADGSGTVPVQLQYSNAVHGPEGPIPQPYPLAFR